MTTSYTYARRGSHILFAMTISPINFFTMWPHETTYVARYMYTLNKTFIANNYFITYTNVLCSIQLLYSFQTNFETNISVGSPGSKGLGKLCCSLRY